MKSGLAWPQNPHSSQPRKHTECWRGGALRPCELSFHHYLAPAHSPLLLQNLVAFPVPTFGLNTPGGAQPVVRTSSLCAVEGAGFIFCIITCSWHWEPQNEVNTKGQFFRASFGKNPRFQIQLDKRPLSPGTSREAGGAPCLNPRRGLSRLVITFLPRSKRLLISWLQSPSSVILEPQKIKSDTVSTVSPSISHEVMGPDAMIFVFWMLSFKPTFSLSSFTFIKRLFSSSSLSAIRVVSSAYLRLLIFLTAILIPACASSSPAFLRMPPPSHLPVEPTLS